MIEAAPKRKAGRITMAQLIGKQGAEQIAPGALIDAAYAKQAEQKAQARKKRQRDEDALFLMY